MPRTRVVKLFIFMLLLLREKCALECRDGKYLQDEACRECRNTCAKCISEIRCTECKVGFFGDVCAKNCSEGCKDNLCDKETGSCLSCGKGFYPKETCERCPDNCIECQNAATCTICKTGHTGTICQKRCLHCIPDSGCSLEEGICTDGCKDGYSGRTCVEQCSSNCLSCDRLDAIRCTSCADGNYGNNCEKLCPTKCLDKSCIKNTGTCTHGCLNGFWGDQCEYVCPLNCRGGKCLRTRGVCSDGCSGNFTGRKCLCPRTCDCDADGVCITCDDNTAFVCDKQCSRMCINNICSSDTERKCFYGCRDGSLCYPLMTKSEDERHVWPIVVSIFVPAAVIILGCVVMSICIKRRRLVNRRRHEFEEATTALTTTTEFLSPFHDTELGSLHENQKENHITDSKEASLEGNIGVRKTVNVDPGKETTQQSAGISPQKQKYQVSLGAKVPLNKLENLTEDDILNEFKRLSASTESKEVDETNSYESTKKPSLAKEYQDSLNACYIDRYKKTEAYIACAWPLGEKKILFWSMVWNEQCDRIVMLSDNAGQEDEQYWPNLDEIFKCGDITVKCLRPDDFEDDFIQRELVIKKETEERVVLQQHFVAWPEDLVPRSLSSLTEFQKYRYSSTSEKVVPVVVHCSDGIGRTGTYIAFDSLIQEGRATGSVDVLSCVQRLREQKSITQELGKQRKTMVQTYEQYAFLYKALQCWFEQTQQENTMRQVPRQAVDSSYEPVEPQSDNPYEMFSLLRALE